MCDWTDATRADGPALVAWLKRMDALPYKVRQLTDVGQGNPSPFTYDTEINSLTVAVKRWERDTYTGFGSVDRWLTRMGFHPSELPDHIWR